jgi:hypothetical protein
MGWRSTEFRARRGLMAMIMRLPFGMLSGPVITGPFSA